MVFDNEKVEIGIVGIGNISHLPIDRLLNTDVRANLLENEEKGHKPKPESPANIRYHQRLATSSRISIMSF